MKRLPISEYTQGVWAGIFGCFCVWALWAYLTSRQAQEVHPGIDFPIEWVQSIVAEKDYKFMEELDEARKKSKLIIMRMDFRNWCQQRNIKYNQAALDAITVADVFRD